MPAGNIASMDAKALPGNDSRYVQLKMSLKEVPDILLDHFSAQDKYGVSHLCLHCICCERVFWCCTIENAAPFVSRLALGIGLYLRYPARHTSLRLHVCYGK